MRRLDQLDDEPAVPHHTLPRRCTSLPRLPAVLKGLITRSPGGKGWGEVQYLAKGAGRESRIVAELYAGHSAARLGTIEVGRRRKPVARRMGTGDRGNQELCVGMLGGGNDALGGACFNEVGAIEHEDRIAHLKGSGKIVSNVEDRDAAVVS